LQTFRGQDGDLVRRSTSRRDIFCSMASCCCLQNFLNPDGWWWDALARRLLLHGWRAVGLDCGDLHAMHSEFLNDRPFWLLHVGRVQTTKIQDYLLPGLAFIIQICRTSLQKSNWSMLCFSSIQMWHSILTHIFPLAVFFPLFSETMECFSLYSIA
jgi:hypothetical protein